MTGPASFRSGLLPTEEFHTRFSDENLAFWTPILVEAGAIEAGHRVLDVGCGTGGFTRAVAEATSASVTGLDQSDAFLDFARHGDPPGGGRVDWATGDAASLPFDDGSFDRVLQSLVLHQLPEPARAVAEAFRVLSAGGVLLIRTIAPEDAPDRIPARYIPSMAAADVARMPPLDQMEAWLEDAGFTGVETRRVVRNAALNLEAEERHVRAEVESRYAFVTAAELEAALERMRADARAEAGAWVDPRPTYLLRASR